MKRWLAEGPPPPSLRALLELVSRELARESESEMESFFRSSVDLLVVLDGEGRVLQASTAFDGWGWPGRELRELTFAQLCVDEERETVATTIASILRTREQVPLATRLDTPLRGRRLVHWQLSVNEQGTRVFGSGRDVTDTEKHKADAALSHRLEAMGRLASAVAHEVNTPLQYLTDNLGFVGDSLRELDGVLAAAQSGDPAALREAVGEADLPYLRRELPRALGSMRDGLRRVSQLVTSLKELAPQNGGSEWSMQEVDVLPLVRSAIATRLEESPGVDVTLELDALPLLECNVGSINRVIVSVLDNAWRAMARRHGALGGHLRVRAWSDGLEAHLSVEDDGEGIPEALRAHVFEPFFTTRDVGQGSGQSLAIARTVMERHHGTIHFAPNAAGGATFTLSLPLPVDASLWD